MAEWTLYEGDCLEVMRQLPDNSIDAVVTDPPYVIGAVSAGNLATKTGTWADMMNSAYWFRAWYEQVWRLLRPHGCFWTFCNWRSLPVVMQAAAQAKIPITSVLVWDKQWIGPGGTQGLRPRYELVALAAKPSFVVPDRATPDIWTCKWAAHKPTGHPAEKPVALLRRIIRESGLREGTVVLDPFAGSGSTMVAAIEEGCNAIGIESEPEYCDLIRRRMATVKQPLSLAT